VTDPHCDGSVANGVDVSGKHAHHVQHIFVCSTCISYRHCQVSTRRLVTQSSAPALSAAAAGVFASTNVATHVADLLLLTLHSFSTMALCTCCPGHSVLPAHLGHPAVSNCCLRHIGVSTGTRQCYSTCGVVPDDCAFSGMQHSMAGVEGLGSVYPAHEFRQVSCLWSCLLCCQFHRLRRRHY
jgi:hypothetical protein